MEKEQILRKAIEKAVKNGYRFSYDDLFPKVTIDGGDKSIEEVMEWICMQPHITHVLFSHEFARSFWGENIVCYSCKKETGTDYAEHVDKESTECTADYEAWNFDHAWRFHLQQLVLSEDRLKYLEQFVV